ncbi:mutator protein MutT [Catenuloplanes nepalensis]|uniref:Mutator protein MutT n=1 Tax=Catenuloplanes nepalensis TaxID=587533 RepID=A0ABT9N335_9ACTN|nr:NUDIX domain-containing protein [Catenuloplanes nepalensis]MDP9798113.1 mutator protein MutT [Catenuloplanes nepalensis]
MAELWPLPAPMVDRMRRFADSGETPAVPRVAATVVMIKPIRPMRVYVMRRASAMVFGGVWAFPGGSVEPGETPPEAAAREVAEEAGVLLDPAALTPWSRWITPEFEPRRFDTYFYLVALPPGADPRALTSESDDTAWVTPEEALARHASGEWAMLPPTLVTLRQLAAAGDLEGALAAAATREASTPIIPRAVDGSLAIEI